MSFFLLQASYGCGGLCAVYQNHYKLRSQNQSQCIVHFPSKSANQNYPTNQPTNYPTNQLPSTPLYMLTCTHLTSTRPSEANDASFSDFFIFHFLATFSFFFTLLVPCSSRPSFLLVPRSSFLLPPCPSFLLVPPSSSSSTV